ncbi:MAG: hypothetical protein AABZ60_13450, partial [Planctomycetota bacterium]
MRLMKKIGLLINLIAFLWILNGCSSGGGSDNNQTGNRGGGDGLDGPAIFGATEFLSEHDGDGVNPFTAGTLSDDVGTSPGTIVEGCFTSCTGMGILVKFSPTITIGTPFTVRSISYFVPPPPTCGGDATVSAEFVMYEAGSDVPGTELTRILMPLDATGLGPAAASPDLKVFTFSPPIVITDLLLGDTDGTFFAGVEFLNTTPGTFTIGTDTDPTPFPDPDGPWVGTTPYPPATVPVGTCPALLPDSIPPSGSVPPTVCLDPVTFGFGRGTSFLKCGAGVYSPVVSSTT